MKQEQVRFERSGSLAIIDIEGYVTKTSGTQIREAFQNVKQGDRAILLRFQAVDTYVNSEGIKALIDLLVAARKNGQPAGITGVSEHLRKLFGMVGITKLSSFFESTEEAVRELLKSSPTSL